MRGYKGNIVLVELVIVLIFFSLSQVILVQVFAMAQHKNVQSRLTGDALLAAQDAAEQLALCDDPEALLKSLGFAQEGGLYRREAAGYSLEAAIARLSQPGGALLSVRLTAEAEDATLFTLPVTRYLPGEVSP